MEQNQNTLAPESDGDSASGSPAVPPAPPITEYVSATGTFVTRPAPAPPPPAEPPVPDPDPVRLRYRSDGWTPERQRQFLVELADCGIVKEAAGRVGMSEKAAWELRRRADDTPFHSAWEGALEAGMRRLHSIAYERAVLGTPKPIFYRGEQIGEQRIYDNRLFLSLLGKAGQPFDTHRAIVVRNRWEDYLEAVEHGWRRPQPRLEIARDDYVWTNADGTWWTCFPPPDGHEVIEQGEYGEEDYSRTLSPPELEAVLALDESEHDLECAERDRFFGLEK